ncbi:hypothetical protein ACHAWO_007686 [Cyclotella atomus]|uniref:Ubiquinone biosynthesis protein n=1 Tax=Cyclotella atomus TaxID=382360 RepID=A0ABD3PT63_9STRA
MASAMMSRRRLSRCLSTAISSTQQRHLLSVERHLPDSSNGASIMRDPSQPPPSVRIVGNSFVTQLQTRHQSTLNDKSNHRDLILSHALTHVHSEGWTDDAIATGTLEAGFPPSYIGRVSSSTSVFGSADLVAFFMDQCNNDLKNELNRLKSENTTDREDTATRLHRALQFRLMAVVPFVSSKRWHEGMAIGALPQNAYRTAQQLDEMAQMVLEYAFNNNQGIGAAQRAAVVAAYAAAELHLVSEGMNETSRGVSGSSISYSGDRYASTWSFLKERCNEASRMLTDGSGGLSIPGIPLNPTHVVAASAVASSLVGAALSLAAPTAAAVVGQALPKVMETMSPLQSYFVPNNSGVGDGTRPSDYQVDNLPPFDSNEVIFSEGSAKST